MRFYLGDSAFAPLVVCCCALVTNFNYCELFR